MKCVISPAAVRWHLLDGNLQWDHLLVAFDRFFGVLVGQPHKHNNQNCSWKWKKKENLTCDANSSDSRQCVKNAKKEKKTPQNHISVVHFYFNLTCGIFILTFRVFSSIFLPMSAKVPSRIPTADWIVGMPCNCLTGILQFPLTLQGHTVTKVRREEGMHRGKFTQPRKQEIQHGDKSLFV